VPQGVYGKAGDKVRVASSRVKQLSKKAMANSKKLLLETTTSLSSLSARHSLLIALCSLFVGLYLLSFWAIGQGLITQQSGTLSLVVILVVGVGSAGLLLHARGNDVNQGEPLADSGHTAKDEPPANVQE